MTEYTAITNPGSAVAVKACEKGINCFVRFRMDAMTHIDAAIAVDGEYTLAKLVKT